MIRWLVATAFLGCLAFPAAGLASMRQRSITLNFVQTSSERQDYPSS